MNSLTSRVARACCIALLVGCGSSADVAPVDAPPATDLDHDGHPSGADCDDSDPSTWQMLPYNFRDGDGDGRTVPMSGMICSGASLPKGYSLVAGEPDCDDADPTVFAAMVGFVDVDGDGVGDGPPLRLCTNGNLPSIYAAKAGDCAPGDPARWQTLAYSFRDADGDGRTIASSGAICSGDSLPPGYFVVPGDPDCDDADPAVFATMTGFLDLDGDRVGDGPPTTLCTNGSLPANYAAAGGDCAPDDPTRWQVLPYAYRDVDGDGAAVVEVGVVCSGATLPATYLTAAPAGRPFDCDDANPAVSIPLTIFVDGDGDGVGAGPGQLACTGGSPPFGFSTLDTDCDDGDAAVAISLAYTAVDFDGDGVTAPALGTRCTAGTLLPPYFASPHGNDCDDTNPSVSVALTVFVDADRDGFGAGPGQQACTNGAPDDGFSTTSTDCNDSDASVWALRSYSAIDEDGDGITVPASGTVCTNGTLPPPFKATQNGDDCDDRDPAVTHFAVLYPDHDGDGVGAPPREVRCIGDAPPAGLSFGGFDDDDTDPTVIENDDDEFDLLLLDH